MEMGLKPELGNFLPPWESSALHSYSGKDQNAPGASTNEPSLTI
jgi:hypothetical protein